VTDCTISLFFSGSYPTIMVMPVMPAFGNGQLYSFDHCSEKWSCWAVHDRPGSQAKPRFQTVSTVSLF